MPMSSGGHVESSNDCATRPKAREIGLTGYAVLIQPSLHIGRYVMATAEHREPCDSRGSCTTDAESLVGGREIAAAGGALGGFRISDLASDQVFPSRVR